MRGLLIVCALAACWVEKRSAPAPAPPPPSHQPVPPQPLDVQRTPVASSEPELYGLDEALADVFSGPLEHVGTGEWFGLFRINACVYRNKRVFVVNIYCTTKEMKAFSIVVLSPARGRVMIYAEAEQPISKLKRRDYFTFKAEASPPPDASLRKLSLAFRYDELREWDEKRYYKWVPGCYGGVEIKRPQAGCLKGLESHTTSWMSRNSPFLDDPPEEWYRVVRELRARAGREGKYVSQPGG